MCDRATGDCECLEGRRPREKRNAGRVLAADFVRRDTKLSPRNFVRRGTNLAPRTSSVGTRSLHHPSAHETLAREEFARRDTKLMPRSTQNSRHGIRHETRHVLRLSTRSSRRGLRRSALEITQNLASPPLRLHGQRLRPPDVPEPVLGPRELRARRGRAVRLRPRRLLPRDGDQHDGPRHRTREDSAEAELGQRQDPHVRLRPGLRGRRLRAPHATARVVIKRCERATLARRVASTPRPPLSEGMDAAAGRLGPGRVDAAAACLGGH